jgi:hypothetical protein
VQDPTKFTLIVNLKAAKAQGITSAVPLTLPSPRKRGEGGGGST